jgi:hypothetical protein
MKQNSEETTSAATVDLAGNSTCFMQNEAQGFH